MILETAKEILQKGYICDNCLGRQFGQVLSGTTNRERGRSIRTVLAMEYSMEPFPIEKSNFREIKFRKVAGKKTASSGGKPKAEKPKS